MGYKWSEVPLCERAEQPVREAHSIISSVNQPNARARSAYLSWFHDLQMQRLQIGALYMFSYVSKEFLEILKSYEDLLEELDVDDEEERTYPSYRFPSPIAP